MTLTLRRGGDKEARAIEITNSKPEANEKGLLFSSNPLKYGGEREIRTPGRGLAATRFSILEEEVLT
jgi:hypothetical protein